MFFINLWTVEKCSLMDEIPVLLKYNRTVMSATLKLTHAKRETFKFCVSFTLCKFPTSLFSFTDVELTSWMELSFDMFWYKCPLKITSYQGNQISWVRKGRLWNIVIYLLLRAIYVVYRQYLTFDWHNINVWMFGCRKFSSSNEHFICHEMYQWRRICFVWYPESGKK